MKFDTAINSDGVKNGLQKIQSLAKSAIKGITTAIAGASAAVATAATVGAKYNAQMEQYIASFGTMLGGADKAQKLLADIKDMGAKTPFQVSDLAKGTQTLLAFGVAEDKVMDSLQMLGDISLGNKDRFDSLTLAFAQCQSTGKLMGQDLLQMVNAGFNPLNEISKMTGKSVAGLKEEMSKGAISADMVTEAFQHATQAGGQFYKALEAQSQTFNGQISTLKDNAMSLLGEITEGFSNSLKDTALPMVNGWMNDLADAFHQGGTSALVAEAGTVLAEALTAAAENTPGIIQAGVTTIKAFVSGMIENRKRIFAAAKEIALSFAEGLIEFLPSSVREPVKKALAELKKSLESGGLKNALKSLGDLFKTLNAAVIPIAKVALPLLVKVIDLLGKNANIVIPALIAFAAALKISQIAGKTTGALTTLSKALKVVQSATKSDGITGFVGSLREVAGKAVGAGGAVGGFGAVLKTLVSPTGLIALGVTACVALGKAIYDNVTASSRKAEETMSTMGTAIANFSKEMLSTQGDLDSFGSALEGYNTLQSDVTTKIAEVQTNITQTLLKGQKDRAGITDDDITNLQQYYQQLSDLHEQQIELELLKTQAVQDTVTLRLQTEAGSADEYTAIANKELATMREQTQAMKDLYAEQYATQVTNLRAQLNNRIITQAEYDAGVKKADEDYRQHIAETDALMGRETALAAQRYSEHLLKQGEYVSGLNTFYNAARQANGEYQTAMREIDELTFDEQSRKDYIAFHEQDRQNALIIAARNFTNNMSEEQKEQVANLMAYAVQTEMEGGKLDDETQKLVDTLLLTWSAMPDGSKDKMREALVPMLEDLEQKSPEMFAKVKALGDGTLSSLDTALNHGEDTFSSLLGSAVDGGIFTFDEKSKQLINKAQETALKVIAITKSAFDIHSPSKKMRNIYNSVGEGEILGLQDKEKELYQTAETINANTIKKLSGGVHADISARISAAAWQFQSSAARQSAVPVSTPSSNITYGGATTNLYQTINTHESLSPSEMTLEAQNFLKRSRWKNP